MVGYAKRDKSLPSHVDKNNMLTEDQAINIVSNYWNSDISDPNDAFSRSQADLTADQEFWVIHGNTKGFVVDGDERRCSVGIRAFIVDASSGELFTVGSAQDISETLQDIREDRASGDQFYVLAAGTGHSNKSDILALRNLMPCGITIAKQILSSSDRYWFTGKRRLLQQYSNELQKRGMPNEVILVDDCADAIEIDWRSQFNWDLITLENRILSSKTQ